VGDVEATAIATIRALAMDAPHQANSGHSGTAMALAPLAHVLWTRILRYDPDHPEWPDRDRFVLSAGHASILQYTMLYLTGSGLDLDDLRQFRQWGSRTPGHPEARHTPGIEVTTGPLGQGIGNAVGMAIAERWLRSRFGADLFDHHVFAICSDGDLMEGISHEAASLAGHLGLGRLVAVYDDNHITIDGETELTLSDDAPARFRAYGWHVEELGEMAEDLDGLEAALRRAMAVEDRPSLLVLRSHIGWPSPDLTDTAAAHGNPFKADEITRTKERLGVPDELFHVPGEVLDWYREVARRGVTEREAWDERYAAAGDRRAELEACLGERPLPGWEAALPSFEAGTSLATRQAMAKVLNATLPGVPGLLAGGADLTGNTGTKLEGEAGQVQSRQHPEGRQIAFGVREHAMGAAMVGMAMHGGVLPVGGTFFVFSDYMRPSVRLAALSRAKVVFVWSHDSVGLGEDGPTHQPVEHLASLRAMPGLRLIRPADANETAVAWRVAVESLGPTGLVLSRQGVPVLEGTAGAPVERGAYVLDSDDDPQVVLLGSGSEVHVCLEAAGVLRAEGRRVRVVSFPSWDLFAEQPEDYRDAVLPAGVPRVSCEAGSTFGWSRYADRSVGIDRFGESAPGNEVLAHLGITPERVAEEARALLTGAHGRDGRTTP